MVSTTGVFQSLIGRLKTDKNYSTFCGLFSFQSLIGRLKHSFPSPDGELGSLFQSLIGRLKTPYYFTQQLFLITAFQSLIGRLKTNIINYLNTSLIGFNPL